MKRLPSGHGYLGRMVNSSINKEIRHEPTNTLSAAAAIAVRSAVLEGHPLAHTFGGIVSLMHPRLRRAATIAASSDALRLVDLVGKMTVTRSSEEEVAQDIAESALYSGLITSDQYDRFLLTIGNIGSRAYITAGELAEKMDSVDLETAQRGIRKRAYTTRR
jgi:hypothetical protein